MTRPFSVLVVDDEPDALDIFQDLFGNDYQIFTAQNGRDALDQMKTHDIHLVFTDERMPGMSGVELLEHVKTEWPDVVRILTTGVTDLQIAIDSINRGHIHRYIPKPWNEAELRTILDEQLRIRELDQENKRLARIEKEYEQEKLQSQIKEEMLKTVSHEFRTPLTSIIGYLELLISGHFGQLADSQQAIGEVLLESSLYLKQILENILLLAKIRAETTLLHLEDVNLNGLLHDITESLRPMAHQKNLLLVLEESDLPNIVGDQEYLRLALTNLIHNALKFTIKGLVSIRSRVEDHEVKIFIQDTGRGISAADQAIIFAKFQQLSDENTSELKGFGLGLSIAQELVRIHEGRITVQSQSGQGSVFSVHLPVDLHARI
jgi:signal transduction histidine kinase